MYKEAALGKKCSEGFSPISEKLPKKIIFSGAENIRVISQVLETSSNGHQVTIL